MTYSLLPSRRARIHCALANLTFIRRLGGPRSLVRAEQLRLVELRAAR